MPLTEIQPAEEGLYAEAQTFFNDLLGKLRTFVGHDLKTVTYKAFLGRSQDYFEQFKRRRYLLTRIVWAQKGGLVGVLNSVDAAIAMAGYMWALPADQIAQRVKSRELDGELRDVYKEISKQLFTLVSQHAAGRVPDAKLEFTTEDMPASGVQNDLVEAGNYLMLLTDVSIGEMQPAPFHVFLAEPLLPSLFPSGKDVFLSPPGLGDIAGSLVTTGFAEAKAGELMVKDYPVIDADKTVADADELLRRREVEALPIVDEEGRVLRIVTRNNVEIMKSVFFDMPGVQDRSARVLCLPLSEVNRTQELIYVHEEEPLMKALRLMLFHKIHSIPVMDADGHFLGMLTSFQILGLMAPSGGGSVAAGDGSDIEETGHPADGLAEPGATAV